jgi:hypothetical protein
MPTQTTRKVLNLFLASPGDVGLERAIAQEVVTNLNKILGRPFGLYIELHLWEDIAPGYGDPQDRINPDVDECNLFIGLVWERWGQRTKCHSSGFEEEFERAVARRKATGEPEIWLVFKAPRLEKLDEPGPQLEQVLKFRELQISLRQVHFADLKNADEWRSELQTWLLKHAIAVSGTDIARANEPQATSSPLALASPPENSSSALTESKVSTRSRVPKQLIELSNSFGEVLRRGELGMSRNDESFLTEFDIARLYLLAATWIARRYTTDFMGIHAANLLYKYRHAIEATDAESDELFRSFLQDRSGIVPGWFWVRDDFPEGPAEALFRIATTDASGWLRVRALKLMAAARVKLPTRLWSSLPISDEDPEVSSAALAYIGLMGDETALPMLDVDATDGDQRRAAAAAKEAKLRILIRLRPKEAFSELLASHGYFSSELEEAFGEKVKELPTEDLVKGAENPSEQIRKVSVRELARRGDLSLELADSLEKDPSVDVRQLALQEMVYKRGMPELARLQAAAPKTVLLSNLLGGKQEIDFESLRLNYYRTLPTDKLLATITWSSVDGAPAYKVLAIDRYEDISSCIQSDLQNGFERIRQAWISDLQTKLGAESAAEYAKDFEEKKLDEFIRSQFTVAALSGLVAHALPSDVVIARKHLQSENRDTRLAATQIISKFGNAEDVQTLLNISTDAWGELKDFGPATAIRLSSDPDGLAFEILGPGNTVGRDAALRWLMNRDSDAVRQYFLELLTDESDRNRARGTYYLSRKLNRSEIEELLLEYPTRSTYYYDVVTWLDRHLYSPPPLKQLFDRELEQEADL